MRRLLVPILAAASLGAAPARAEVLQKSDSGFIVREVAEVPVDPYAAWAGLIAPAKWWNPEHTWSKSADNLYIDAQATGCFCELLPPAAGAPEGTRRGSVQHMRVIFSDPGKVMRLSGALGPLQSEALTGTLTITFKPTEKGTRILWEYVVGGYMRYKPDEIAPAVDAMLGEQIARLAASLGAAPPEKTATGDSAPADGAAPPPPPKPKPKAPAKKPAPKKTGD